MHGDDATAKSVLRFRIRRLRSGPLCISRDDASNPIAIWLEIGYGARSSMSLDGDPSAFFREADDGNARNGSAVPCEGCTRPWRRV